MDEAYQPFASKSYLDRLTRHPHVLLMRTLSKFGFGWCSPGLHDGSQGSDRAGRKVRPPYNISVLNTEAALFALEHADEFARQAEAIKSERERVLAALAKMPGAKACRVRPT